jgi:hypothetical protein
MRIIQICRTARKVCEVTELSQLAVQYSVTNTYGTHYKTIQIHKFKIIYYKYIRNEIKVQMVNKSQSSDIS